MKKKKTLSWETEVETENRLETEEELVWASTAKPGIPQPLLFYLFINFNWVPANFSIYLDFHRK